MELDKLRWSLNYRGAELTFSGNRDLGEFMLGWIFESLDLQTGRVDRQSARARGVLKFEGLLSPSWAEYFGVLGFEVHEIRDGRDVLLSTAHASR